MGLLLTKVTKCDILFTDKKGGIFMSAKSISHCQGKGSIGHNNRLFSAKNVDASKSCNNIWFAHQDIAEAYQTCFGSAQEEYNARQKRSDRKIKGSYFNYLFGKEPCGTVQTSSDKRKSFYEDLVQIGTKEDTGVNSADAEVATECLTEYMKGFQERNPNFYVFNAVIHLDEATPHLHIDYIPFGHYKRGMSKQNGIAQALKEMGYGTGKDAISRWREQERKILEEICNNRGIEIAETQKARGYSFTCEEYKTYKDEINALESQKNALINASEEITELKYAEEKSLSELRTETSKVEKKLSRLKKLEFNIAELMKIEPKKTTLIGNDCIIDQDDWKKMKAAAINGCTAVSEAESLKKLKSYQYAYLDKKKELEEAEMKINILNKKINDYLIACERNPAISDMVAEEVLNDKAEKLLQKTQAENTRKNNFQKKKRNDIEH